MFSLSVIVETRIRVDCEERFLVTTRLYGLKMRRHPDTTRFDLFKRTDAPCDFVVQITFTNEKAADAFLVAPNTKNWMQSIAGFLDGPMSIRRAMPLSAEPLPPIARPPPLPVLETLRFPTASRALELRLPRLEIVLERVEFASAHETRFLGGAPDPCIVIGCYAVEPFVHTETLMGRALYRLKVTEPTPHAVVSAERLLDLPVHFEPLPRRACLVLLAFEENGGSDVRSAYQTLGDPEHLLSWRTRESEPDPQRLGQHAGATLSDGDGVQLLCDGRPLAETASDDSWVGASLSVVEFTTRPEERVVRCHTRSPDGRNDWLFELSLRLG